MSNEPQPRVEEFVIGTDDEGRLHFIYDDRIAFLNQLGDSETKRASNVEPDGHGGWTADMAPVGGPVLGPFALRGDALSAEVEYLKLNVI